MRLPEGYELVQASVEGVIVSPLPMRKRQDRVSPLPVGEGQAVFSPLPVGDGQGVRAWRLPLASPRRPQRVEVIFRGAAAPDGAAGRLHFEAPSLGELPIHKMLWTVLLPESWTADVPQDAATVAIGRAQMLRLKTAAAANRSLGNAASTDGPAEVLQARPARHTSWGNTYPKPARRPWCSTFGVRSQISFLSN